MQPWDRDDWIAPSPADVSAALAPVRRAALKSSLGHYPAVFAILDCVEFGLPQSLEGGIRSEMTSFVDLVLRPEPRAMIQTMFLGRVDYERLERKGQLPDLVEKTVARRARGAGAKPQHAARIGGRGVSPAWATRAPLRERRLPGYWLESDDPRAASRARRSRAHQRGGRAARPRAQRRGVARSPTTPRCGKPAIPPISAVPSPSPRRGEPS